MTLYQTLQQAQSEEDVKDAYIAALKLKKVTKGLVDIQTEEIWFEAKHKPTDVYTMFTQLLYYVCHAHKDGEPIPPLLCVIDNEKAALMSTDTITPIFKDKSIKWGKSASQVSRELIAQVSPYINDHFIVYHIAEDEAAFLEAVSGSLKNGGIVRTQITPNNLKKVFDRWVELIGLELGDLPQQSDYALLFYADIMHDGKKAVISKDLNTRLVIIDDNPAFLLRGETYELASVKGYREFWNIYHRPPAEEHRNYLMERRDQLIPLDERQFKGAYYTPLKVVEKAYELLDETLGKTWQKNYIVWDMCCGVGNLETKHSNLRNVFMSTLDTDDINVMQTSGQFPAATRFQYDYLNDDIAEDGTINYDLTGKLPAELRQHIQEAQTDSKKKILVLINPPYAEAATATTFTGKGENKTGVSNQNKIAATSPDLGYAKRELFVQFLLRIQRELPNAMIAMFSTLKYVNAPNFAPFREIWSPKFLNGFVVHSKSFDGLKGDFPIGFLIWDLSKNGKETVFRLPAFDKKCAAFGDKNFYRETEQPSLNEWIERPKPNDLDALPLKNALSPTDKTSGDIRGRKWADNAIGGMICKGSDIQNAGRTAILSSGYCSAGGFLITPDNFEKSVVAFSVMRLIKPTWLNDRDQFLQPNQTLPESFYTDCLIYMLFSGSNLTAGTAKDALEWNGKKWQLINHFIPFDEQQVGAKNKFQSHFMSDYLRDKKLSKEAKAVYDTGLALWKAFYAADIERKVRDEYLLANADVGWYQIRNALKIAAPQTDFTPFETAYKKLAEKLEPLVYEYGFLKQ